MYIYIILNLRPDSLSCESIQNLRSRFLKKKKKSVPLFCTKVTSNFVVYWKKNLVTRWECVVNATPRPLYPRGRDPVPVVEEAGWAPVLVWTAAENRAQTGIRSPDCPAGSESLYRLSYRCYFHLAQYRDQWWVRVKTIGTHMWFITSGTASWVRCIYRCSFCS